ncbi:preprotein translocase subunit SecG [Kallotenue papyrolyticum]|uniref:preprotein translocase subunit SecG n=1 Tax=Kallotenue papyrolyticum TaxID=1325125 RepID=UPI0004785336|nr:preprotein translocase subunit SecG [Kallotenue papyrolyticum]
MQTFINLAQILLAVTLIVLVLLQAKGNSASAFFNREAATTYRTRRGIERTILQATIVIAVLFCLLSLINNILPRFI